MKAKPPVWIEVVIIPHGLRRVVWWRAGVTVVLLVGLNWGFWTTMPVALPFDVHTVILDVAVSLAWAYHGTRALARWWYPRVPAQAVDSEEEAPSDDPTAE